MFLTQKIQCTTCKHKKHHCDHVKFVEEMASSTPDADLPDAISEFLHVLHQRSGPKPKRNGAVCVSSSKIPFILSSTLSEEQQDRVKRRPLLELRRAVKERGQLGQKRWQRRFALQRKPQ